MERLEHDDPAAKVLAGDRRLTMQLMGLWRGLRATDGCPRRETFLAAVPPELLEDCFVAVPTVEGGALCRIGGRIGYLSGVAGDSCPVRDLPPGTLLWVVTRDVREAVARATPVVSDGEFQAHGRRVLYRSILLPLADDGGEVDRVFGGARCRILQDA
jgi:hypothetical protein